MDWNGENLALAGLCVDVVTARYALVSPARRVEQPAQVRQVIGFTPLHPESDVRFRLTALLAQDIEDPGDGFPYVVHEFRDGVAL